MTFPPNFPRIPSVPKNFNLPVTYLKILPAFSNHCLTVPLIKSELANSIPSSREEHLPLIQNAVAAFISTLFSESGAHPSSSAFIILRFCFRSPPVKSRRYPHLYSIFEVSNFQFQASPNYQFHKLDLFRN